MATGGGTTTQQTSQQSAPWGPIQPYLTDVAQQAQNLQQSQQGNNQLPSTFAPFSSQTTSALNAATDYGNGTGNSLINSAQGSLSNLMNPQGTPGNGTLSSLSQGYSDSGNGIAGSVANGSAPGMSTMGSWANQANINPYLNAQYQAASKPVIDSVNATMGMAGRTGSGADQQMLTRNLGDLSSSIFSNGYDNAANRSLSAAQSYTGDQLAGAGQLSGNALNQANVRGQAANNLNSTMMNASQLAPSLNDAGWQNIQNLLGVGTAYDTQNQNQLNDMLSQYQYSQQQPWNILNGYSGAVSGLGALGGTSSGTNTTQAPGSMGSAIGAAGSVAGAALMVF